MIFRREIRLGQLIRANSFYSLIQDSWTMKSRAELLREIRLNWMQDPPVMIRDSSKSPCSAGMLARRALKNKDLPTLELLDFQLVSIKYQQDETAQQSGGSQTRTKRVELRCSRELIQQPAAEPKKASRSAKVR